MIYKHIFTLVLIVIITFPQSSQAKISKHTSTPWSLGLLLGQPSGITPHYKLNSKKSIQGLLAYSFFDGQLYLGTDYLQKFYHITKIKSDLYWGVGGYFNLHSSQANGKKKSHTNHTGFGARLPLGLRHDLYQTPLHIFLETAVRSLVIPQLKVSLDLVLGIRYQF